MSDMSNQWATTDCKLAYLMQIVSSGVAAGSAYMVSRSVELYPMVLTAGLVAGALRDLQLRACCERSGNSLEGRASYHEQLLCDVIDSEATVIVLNLFTPAGMSLWVGYSAGALGARLWRDFSDWAVSKNALLGGFR